MGFCVPFVFKCSKCGSIIYVDLHPRLNESYLENLLARLGGKCPNCGHKLRIPPLKVEVSPLNGRKEEELKTYCLSGLRKIPSSSLKAKSK